MNYYDREEWPGFLASIRANPDDDLTRLVCADWLEENGEPERAEFVRASCRRKLTYTHRTGNAARVSLVNRPGELVLAPAVADVSYYTERGFVSRVRAPLAVLIGGECEAIGRYHHDRCNGGRIETPNPAFTMDCPDCHGTGRTTGVLRELLRREPLGPESVEVSDRDSKQSGGENGRPSWWRETAWRGRDGQGNAADILPDDVFEKIGDMNPDSRRGWGGLLLNQHLSFSTKPAARLALSRAVYAVCSG